MRLTNSFQARSLADASAIRLLFVCLLTLNLVGLASPSAFGQTWQPKASMLTPRGALGVGFANGFLFSVGGFNNSTGAQRLVEAYDPIADQWQSRALLASPRNGVAVGVVNGVVYAIGGDTDGGATGYLASVEAYDTTTTVDQWFPRASMNTPRDHLAVAQINGILYAVGGQFPNRVMLNTLEAYDPGTNTWTPKAPMPTPRLALGAAAVNGVLYAVGGQSPTGISAAVEAYDPTTNSWSTKASLPLPRGAAAVAALNGIVYAVGGSGPDCSPCSTVFAYDPQTDTWTTVTPMQNARYLAAAGVVNGKLFAAGGAGIDGYLSSVEAFTPNQSSFGEITTVARDVGRPFSVAVHGGFAYVADPSAHTVWQLDLSSGAKVAVAGTGEQGFNGDGIAATLAQLDNPTGVAVDPASGELYIADTGNHAIRKVATPGVAGALITTVAGIPTAYAVGETTPTACAHPPAGFDMSQCTPATSLRLFGPRAVAVDGSGNVFITDRMNQQIKRLDKPTGFLFAVAGVAGFPGNNDGSTADCTIECFPARFNSPVGVAVDDAGNVYVADEGNNAIRMISGGFVSTLSVPTGSLLRPTGVAPLSSGGPSLYVADYGHNRIQLLNCGDGCRLRSVAGNGEAGFSGDGGPATAAQLNSPIGVALDGSLLYIADLLNGRIRKVDFTPTVIP